MADRRAPLPVRRLEALLDPISDDAAPQKEVRRATAELVAT
jgi:hypothetical protein